MSVTRMVGDDAGDAAATAAGRATPQLRLVVAHTRRPAQQGPGDLSAPPQLRPWQLVVLFLLVALLLFLPRCLGQLSLLHVLVVLWLHNTEQPMLMPLLLLLLSLHLSLVSLLFYVLPLP